MHASPVDDVPLSHLHMHAEAVEPDSTEMTFLEVAGKLWIYILVSQRGVVATALCNFVTTL